MPQTGFRMTTRWPQRSMPSTGRRPSGVMTGSTYTATRSAARSRWPTLRPTRTGRQPGRRRARDYDFSDADRRAGLAAGCEWPGRNAPEQRMQVYVRSLVRPGVEVGPSPAIPATPRWHFVPRVWPPCLVEVEISRRRREIAGLRPPRLHQLRGPEQRAVGNDGRTPGGALPRLHGGAVRGLPSSEHVAPGGAGAGGRSPEAAVEPLGGPIPR